MSALSSIWQFLQGRISECTSMGAWVGFMAGLFLAMMAFIYPGPVPAAQHGQIAATMALGAAVVTWLLFFLLRRVTALTLVFLFTLAFAVSWLLTGFIIAVPAAQLFAPPLGVFLGITIGALACQLCSRRGVRHG